MMKQFLVFVEQGFAFSGVGDHCRDFGSELRGSGKSTAYDGLGKWNELQAKH